MIPFDVIRHAIAPFVSDDATRIAMGRTCHAMVRRFRNIPLFVTVPYPRPAWAAERFPSTSPEASPWAIGAVTRVKLTLTPLGSNPLPQSLHILELESYRYPLPVLPKGLLELHLGYHFDFPLNALPNGLQILHLGKDFNRPLPDVLPNGLQSLYLGASFNHPLPPFPDELKVLLLGNSFNHPLPETLPKGLRRLSLGYAFKHPLPPLPDGLQDLGIEYFPNPLPSLPTGLKKLTLGAYRFPLPCFLPEELQVLDLGFSFNHPLPKTLPKGLHTLDVGWKFNQLLPVAWPKELRTLKLSPVFDQPVCHWPCNLIKLRILNDSTEFKTLPPFPSTLRELIVTTPRDRSYFRYVSPLVKITCL